MKSSSLVMTARCLFAAALIASPFGATAKELEAGFVISAKNYDEIKGDTFEGKTIASMVPEKVELQIRKYNMIMKLRHSEPFVLDPRYVKASEDNIGKVSLAADKTLVGWRDGQPFPKIDENDPDAALKVMYNWTFAPPFNGVLDSPGFQYLLIDGTSGLERVQEWTFRRFFFQSRWGDKDGSTAADPAVLFKEFITAKYPFDIRGLGIFGIRSINPVLPENWAYLRASRRVRKLTGGSWMDPVGATDQLNDDLEIYNIHPLLYKGFKLIGKRTILAIAHDHSITWTKEATNDADKYPLNDLTQAPFWNFNRAEFEPREVWVVDAIPPDEHPYSHKIIYMETQAPRPYYAEAYDRKGDFWKFLNFTTKPEKAPDGTLVLASGAGVVIDFKRNHATVFVTGADTHFYNADMKPDFFSISTLEKMGGG